MPGIRKISIATRTAIIKFLLLVKHKIINEAQRPINDPLDWVSKVAVVVIRKQVTNNIL
jgi:hypothetical protein